MISIEHLEIIQSMQILFKHLHLPALLLFKILIY